MEPRQPPNMFLNALAEAILAEELSILEEQDRGRIVRQTAAFLAGQLASLSLGIRALFSLGMFAFRTCTRLRYLRSFCSLPVSTRSTWIALWAEGRLALTRKLFRPARSIILLFFYEVPEVIAALDAVRAEPGTEDPESEQKDTAAGIP